jgi:ribosomal protein S8
MEMSGGTLEFIFNDENVFEYERELLRVTDFVDSNSRCEKLEHHKKLIKSKIAEYEKIEDGKQGVIKVTLKYVNKERVIKGIKRISKPGLRVYAKSTELPQVLNGLGVAIISTSNGVMTDREARKNKLGGEVVAFVW